MRGVRWPWIALPLVVGWGCGTPADAPCDPACGGGMRCYYGVCTPVGDGGASDDAGRDAVDDGGGDDATAVVPGKLDLLFVIDNSSSMGDEQQQVAGTFPMLLGALFTPPLDPGTGGPLYPPVTDLNVGVVSSDMGAGPYTVPTCAASHDDDGVLRHTPSSAVPGCDPSYPTFLHAAGAPPDSSLANAFACIAVLGTNGCGFEQPLGSMDKALTVHARPGGPNAGFLRADAALGIVVLSDENDCSTEDTTIFDPAAGDDLALRCHTHADRLTDVAQFADDLRGLRPDGRFAIGMLVGVPPSSGVCNTTGDLIGPCLSDPIMTEQIDSVTGLLKTVCTTAAGSGATPGARYVGLARNLGAHAFVRSICDPQLPSFFQTLAELVQTTH